ncbi:putative Ribonuclease p protein subunit p29 [Cocos nucifera]|uniref:Putative Ribonuclease p protein subunit p29 n=1 Tax=Cocos nucifera TaxID=13894 RepID=A0A8K0MZY4_COCNU|nr:putative Ribonuclease p protein subunit p29 [Cocos nucifera]
MASQTTTPQAALSEGRKRALAALDRRFAIEAELLQEREQRHESKKRKRAPEGERESERGKGEDIASLASTWFQNLKCGQDDLKFVQYENSVKKGQGSQAPPKKLHPENLYQSAKKHLIVPDASCFPEQLGLKRYFNLFKPMHEMWKSYIIELLKETRKKQLAECLLMADLHGAFFLVVECKTIAFKGVSGIMIRETAETFGIITQDNRFRGIPCRGKPCNNSLIATFGNTVDGFL